MTERSAAGFVRTLLRFRQLGMTGVLSVRAEGVTTTIYLSGGKVTFAEGGTLRESLGRLLVEDGTLSEEQYAHAIDVMTDRLIDHEPMRLGEVLVRLGFVGHNDVHGALAAQVRRKLGRCLQWDRMALEFRAEDLRGLQQFPTDLEPVVLAGVRLYFGQSRMEDAVKPYAHLPLSLREEPQTVVARFAMNADDARVVRALDGRASLETSLAALAAEGIGPLPVATALILADQVTVANAAPTRTPAAEAVARAAPPAAGRPAVTRRARPQRSKTAEPRRLQEDAAAQVRTGDAARAPGSSAAGRAQGLFRRRQRSTWTDDVLPRRQAGTHSPLSSSGTGMEAPDAPSEAPPQRPTDGEARMRAEQAYCRGLRLLRSESYAEAQVELELAASLVVEVAEYRLCALWARYRCAAGAERLAMLRADLATAAGEAARQDRRLAFPPYVLAHLALHAGDETRALQLYRIAAARDPANLDALRHARLLASRAQR